MLQVTLVPQSREQHLHTWRKTLLLIKVQILYPDLLAVLWSLHLRQMEVYGVVIAQVYQNGAEPGILQDCRQVLVSPMQLSPQLLFKLGSSDGV